MALKVFFPVIAQRYEECATWMQSHYGISPEFGLFWNLCINGPCKQAGIPRVQCAPHVDAFNLALGVCAVYVYGKYQENEWS